MKPWIAELATVSDAAMLAHCLDELNGIGGKILKTSVSHEDAAKLQAALSAAR